MPPTDHFTRDRHNQGQSWSSHLLTGPAPLTGASNPPKKPPHSCRSSCACDVSSMGH